MIAALIGVVIFTGLFGGLSLGFYFVKQQRDDLRATEIMEQQIEGIRLCAWGGGSGTNIIASQLFNSSIVPTSFTAYEVSGSGYNSNTVYTGTITIKTNGVGTNALAIYNSSGTNFTAATPPYISQLALVTVTVSWNDYHNKNTNTYTRSMSTLVAQNGMQTYIYSH